MADLDYEDPVRWEVAAQTRTLLSSNASLLDAVASSKFIGGGRHPIKMGAFARGSAVAPQDEGGSQIIHYAQAGDAGSTMAAPASRVSSGALASSASAPSLFRGGAPTSQYCSRDSNIYVQPYQSLVGEDQRASEYAFADRSALVATVSRPPSAGTISRVARDMSREFRERHAELPGSATDRHHRMQRHERDASVAAITSVRPNALVEHYEKSRRAKSLRTGHQVRKRFARKTRGISLNLSTGISMIRKQTMDENRAVKRIASEQRIKVAVNRLKRHRKQTRDKMKNSFTIQKKDSLAQFHSNRAELRERAKIVTDQQEQELERKRKSRHVLQKTSQPGFELLQTTNKRGRDVTMYVPRTGRRSLAGSRVLANDLEQIPTATICVDGSTIFEDEEEMFMEEARGYHNHHVNNSDVMEMRLVQPNGSSALLDASVWRVDRAPSMAGRGSSAGGGGAGGNGGGNRGREGGGSGGLIAGMHMDASTHATGGSQLWGGEDGGGDGLDFLLAYHNHHQRSLIEQRQQQQTMTRGSTRGSTPSNVRSRNPMPSNPAPFGSVSGRSFTPTHDSVIGALPPPWGLVSPHHATG